MHCASWFLGGIVGLLWAPVAMAAQGDGLTPDAGNLSWDRWQGSISLGAGLPAWQASLGGAESSGLKIDSVSLIGNYYFSRSLVGHGNRGGFRTTGGLIYGPRSQLTSWRPLGARQQGLLGVDRHVVNGADGAGGEGSTDFTTLPYLGVGYTTLSTKGTWRFNADLGMLALSPGSSVKLGKAQGTNPGLDEVLREMRIAPLLQFGVTYSF
jgi:hypothetical protein